MPNSNNAQNSGHNPNPFDFVSFSDCSSTYELSELKNCSPLKSGYITVGMRVLTPVHIIGRQDPFREREGIKIFKSHFYEQDGSPCIPGSSVKGMLRAFMEAVTNGWVSQANDEYPKTEGGRNTRHIKFASWESREHVHGCIGNTSFTSPPAIPDSYKPSPDDRMDIASYLFGYVDESTDRSRAGRIIIEDAYVKKENLLDCQMVDIDGNSIMGGPRPRANWWYMRPREVWLRNVRFGGRKGEGNVAHFVGDRFWGRKFYYHQNPKKCIEYYNKYRNIYTYAVSCMSLNITAPFRIYFDRVPEKLLKLFCTCLCMPTRSRMRHKLGFGKAFGYGSVKFTITSAKLRTEKTADFPDTLSAVDENSLVKAWTDAEIKKFIDMPSLKKLAQMLTYAPEDKILFTYPPFDNPNFKKVIQASEFNDKTDRSLSSPVMSVDDPSARDIAQKLSDVKRPIHFQVYQESAEGYEKIQKRGI